LFGLVFFSCGVSCLSSPFIIKYLLDTKNYQHYFIIFWTGTFLQLISAILCVFMKEEPFQYIPIVVKKLVINKNDDTPYDDNYKKSLNSNGPL
jgi:hypothetical protein